MSAARRRSGPSRLRSIVLILFLLLSLIGLIQQGPSAGADTTGTSTPAVSLAGDGSFDPYLELIDWQGDLRNAGLDPGYVPLSGHLGRQELLAGATDYAISGVPFTSDELAGVPGGSSAFVSAPVFVGGLSVLAVAPPGGYGVNHYSCDPSTVDCQTSIANGTVTPTFTAYTGPFSFPPTEMSAAMLLTSLADTTSPSGTQTLGLYDEWDHPDILKASGIQLGQDDAFYPSYEEGDQQSLLTPVTYFQSGAAEQNYYAQEYAATAAPKAWTGIEQYAEGIFSSSQAPQPVNITETLPGRVPYGGLSKEGLRQAVQVLEANSNAMSLVSPSGLYQFQTDPASYHVGSTAAFWIGVQNASGQYVDPSPATIDAAVDAGGDQPLYALTHQVAGQVAAYPLTYVDRLYAPATGLTQQKTEAIATMIRYLATAGQEYDAKYGDGRLSPGLVSEALDSANHLVLSNCTGSGETVAVSSDPGPYMPKLPSGSGGAKDIAAIGPMLHCNAVAPAAATTTTSPSTSTTVASGRNGLSFSGSGGSSGALGPFGGGSGTGGLSSGSSSGQSASSLAGSAGGAASGKAAGSSGPIVLSALPRALPFSASPLLDRLAAAVVGAVLVLLLRRPIWRIIGSVRP